MNLKQLEAMSDRELNVLSAVKVMGWKLTDHIHENEVCVFNPQHNEETDQYIGTLWNPTTDMKDAMELVVKLGENFNFDLNYKPCGTPHLEWEATFDDPGIKFTTTDITPSRAIVIASILSKEETE